MAAIWTAPRTATTGELETAAFWNTYVRDNEEYLKSVLDAAASAATADVLMMRDSSGRAQVAAPSAAADIARKDTVDAVLNSHAGLTNPHSATSAATANRLVLRDSSGRAQVAAPSAAADIARKDTVTAHTNAASAVHGLGSSVNVLGNRSASGEFIQRASTTTSSGATTSGSFGCAESKAVTFPVAFSATPRVFAQTQQSRKSGGNVSAVSTTGFSIGAIGNDSAGDLVSRSIVWLALGE